MDTQTEVKTAARIDTRATILLLLTIGAAAAFFSMPARSDPPSYFGFADQRSFLGIPHFMDVISNAPWAFVSIEARVFSRPSLVSWALNAPGNRRTLGVRGE